MCVCVCAACMRVCVHACKEQQAGVFVCVLVLRGGSWQAFWPRSGIALVAIAGGKEVWFGVWSGVIRCVERGG